MSETGFDIVGVLKRLPHRFDLMLQLHMRRMHEVVH